MKKYLILLILPLIALIAMGAGFANPVETHRVQADSCEVSRVCGMGRIKAQPDIAYISFSVDTKNALLETARTENASSIQAVLAALAEKGITEENIKTTGFYICPEYDYSAGLALTGYRVGNTVQVTVTNLDEVGNIIDTATANGANTVTGVDFAISDRTQIYKQALAEAVTAAKAKAQGICQALGASEVKIISVKETPCKGFGRNNGFALTKVLDAALRSAETSTSVIHGDMEISAKVMLTYELVW